jgi:hypothetical protein
MPSFPLGGVTEGFVFLPKGIVPRLHLVRIYVPSAQRLEPKLHGQGPRAEADAARRLPARSCEAKTADLQPP